MYTFSDWNFFAIQEVNEATKIPIESTDKKRGEKGS